MQTQITELIETWEADKIAEALSLIGSDKALLAAMTKRYAALLTAVSGKTLKSLADFPAKWQKANNAAKAACIAQYPADLPFFLEVIDLNAKLRVDTWRDSHYSNQIPSLPPQIGQFKNVKELHLKHQGFESLPEELGDMENLEVLNLEDCDLDELPDFILKLQQLRVLILTQNYGLKTIPDLGKLPNLEEVDFNYTRVSSLSDDFFNLKNIKKIRTSQCDLDKNLAIIRRLQKAFPMAEISTYSQSAIDKEDNLNENEYKDKEKIKIDESNMNYLPEHLFAANAVKELEIRSWNLLELPDNFDTLQTLEVLKLEVGNEVVAFPKSICRLKNLKSLHLRHGRFDTLPDEFGDLENLEYLFLEGLHFEKLPATFSKLKNLKTFEIEYGSFDIFSVIGGCTSLETLEIKRHSGAFAIENSLHHLTNLQTVKLHFSSKITNDIYKLPPTLKELKLQDDRWKAEESALSFAEIVNYFHDLKKLDTDNIDLSDISVPIAPNTTLRSLSLNTAKFTALPDSLPNLQALLEVVMFDCKQLTALNPAIYDCPNLQYFRTSRPAFTTIPEGISRSKLTRIGFEGGQMTHLPEEIYEMTQLEKIAVGESPLFKDKAFKTKIKRKIKGIKIVKNWYD